MARRPSFSDEPKSRLAAWSSRCAFFALAVAVLSIVILRSNLLEIVPALATFAGALAFAVLAILLAFGGFIVIWRQGLAGLGSAVLGLFLGLAMLTYPGYLGYRAYKLPPISDVTTDAANPPAFDALARQRPRARNSYPGAATAEQQRKAYPDIAALQLSVPAKQAFDLTMTLITKRKWQVADSRAPAATARAGGNTGVIEATARTPIMGFRDDVVLRFTPLGQGGAQGTRVDMRSASRFGTHDFGANASRVRSLLEDLDDAAGNAPEAKNEPEPDKPGKKGKKQEKKK